MTKRPFISALFAAILGAIAASATVVLIAGGSPAKTTTTMNTGASATGTRREAASTALTATQIYKQASPGVVSIRAVNAEGGGSGTGIVLNDRA